MATRASPKGSDGALSARQVRYVQILADPANAGRSASSLAQELGVNRKTIYRWNEDSRVQKAIEHEIRKHSFRMLPYAWDCLRERMQKDTQALKLYFSLVGQHRDQVDVSGPGGGPVQLAALRDMSDEDLQALVEAD